MGSASDSSPTATIATKLSPPTAPVPWIPRQRLFDLLERGCRAGTTLVRAPAGSGKTALVASWLASGIPGRLAAWLSLDARDDSRRAFWRAVLDALVRADPADAVLGTLELPSRGRVDGIVTALVERLAERERELVLVLDDLHELRDPAIEEDLTALLRHAPAALRLILIARTEPSLGLQRLRVSGRLTEIDGRELTFSAGEAQALLRRWGATLDAADARELRRRSGGWAAGLVLPALALRDHADPAAFVAGYGGDDRAVADFIRTELLAELPGDLRCFLLRTAIADPLPVALAVELGGRPDAAELLERLARGNALVDARRPRPLPLRPAAGVAAAQRPRPRRARRAGAAPSPRRRPLPRRRRGARRDRPRSRRRRVGAGCRAGRRAVAAAAARRRAGAARRGRAAAAGGAAAALAGAGAGGRGGARRGRRRARRGAAAGRRGGELACRDRAVRSARGWSGSRTGRRSSSCCSGASAATSSGRPAPARC